MKALDARKGVKTWCGVKDFSLTQKWVLLDAELKARPKTSGGVLLFYGLIVELPSDFSFVERDPKIQSLSLKTRFVGSVNGGIFIMDLATAGKSPVLIERIAADSESASCTNRDFESYYGYFIDSAEKLFTVHVKGNDAEFELKQLLTSLSNVVKIGGINN